MVDKVELIWMDGKFIFWDDVNVYVFMYMLYYGFGVFEGICCYEMEDG